LVHIITTEGVYWSTDFMTPNPAAVYWAGGAIAVRRRCIPGACTHDVDRAFAMSAQPLLERRHRKAMLTQRGAAQRCGHAFGSVIGNEFHDVIQRGTMFVASRPVVVVDVYDNQIKVKERTVS